MKKILYLVVFILLSLNVFMLCNFNNLKSKFIAVTNLLFYVQEDNEKLKNVIGYFYLKEGVILENTVCITDNGLKSTLYNEISKETETLVFTYNHLDCSSCVDSVLYKLGSVSISDKYKIIIASNFKSISSIRYLKEKFGLTNAMFLKTEGLGMIETPSLFLIDERYQLSKFLIINQNDYILDHYLKNLNA